MILISHRGNINGKNTEFENQPAYIDKAMSLGYDVEIDLWFNYNDFFLGHDGPEYKINIKWIEERKKKLWIHCKNIDTIVQIKKLEIQNKLNEINYFFHNEDDLTLTSKSFLWVYPGKQPVYNSIAVIPELYDDDLSLCIGICSDNIKDYG